MLKVIWFSLLSIMNLIKDDGLYDEFSIDLM